ncbi:unnamed protein product, partial [Tetraodon nigroviridis]
EYKMKGVEEVKYMRGDENRVNARNQENLVRRTHSLHTHSGLFLTAYQLMRARAHTHTQTHTQRHASHAGSNNLPACVECEGLMAWLG